jgi:hypothetical protein
MIRYYDACAGIGGFHRGISAARLEECVQA